MYRRRGAQPANTADDALGGCRANGGELPAAKNHPLAVVRLDRSPMQRAARRRKASSRATMMRAVLASVQHAGKGGYLKSHCSIANVNAKMAWNRGRVGEHQRALRPRLPRFRIAIVESAAALWLALPAPDG